MAIGNESINDNSGPNWTAFRVGFMDYNTISVLFYEQITRAEILCDRSNPKEHTIVRKLVHMPVINNQLLPHTVVGNFVKIESAASWVINTF